jgi:predicted FMN-binding regulatory protein PaiB
MYTPKLNLITDPQEAVSFMQQFSFATIVTVIDNVPSATHLPFVVSQRDGQIILTSHFAKVNMLISHQDITRANKAYLPGIILLCMLMALLL